VGPEWRRRAEDCRLQGTALSLEQVLVALEAVGITEQHASNISINAIGSEHGIVVNWAKLPPGVDPSSGNLPSDRALRKRQQIENMMIHIDRLLPEHGVAVDFCAGGGHVGLVLAMLRPDARVVLLDRKPISLAFAQRRITELNLRNVKIVQGEVEEYKEAFDLGTALHSCGTATDLVLDKCVGASAAYVLCPCCFGFMADLAHDSESEDRGKSVGFPRSSVFRASGLTEDHYHVLAAAADTQASCGRLSMSLVDMDRNLFMEENGYDTKLLRMSPESCSPKNEMLIGQFDFRQFN